MNAKEKFKRYWGACRAARYDVSQGGHHASKWADAELHSRAFPKNHCGPGRILRALTEKRRAEYWKLSRERQSNLAFESQLALYDAPCK